MEEEKSKDEAGASKPPHKEDEASQKKRADDLWALFLSDVGSRPKSCSAGSPSCSTAQVTGNTLPVRVRAPAPRSEEREEMTSHSYAELDL